MDKKSVKDKLVEINEAIKIAENAFKNKNYESSISNYEKAINIYKKTSEEEDEYIAKLYNNLAESYFALKSYDKANEYYQFSILILQKLSEKNPSSLAISLNNLAMAYIEQGKFKEAEKLHEEALKIREKLYGENHPDTVQSYNNLAGLFKRLGSYEKAKEYFQKALKISEQYWGKEHPETAIIYNNLADLFQSLGNNDEALENYEKSIDILLKTVGENHPNTQLVERNIVLLKDSQKFSKGFSETIANFNQTKPQETQKFFPKNFPPSLIYFTAREKVLENLAERLEIYGTAAFADTHGVGKTSVMIEFAYRNQENYEHILFIRATNNEFSIYVSEILKDLDIALPENAKPEQRLAVLQEWLATNQDWLLLVDNVDDVDFIHKCGFNKPNGKVIYTSNDDKIFKVGTQVKLPKLNDENAMLLLYKHWQDDADAKFEDIPARAHSALKGIAEKFGNHPFSMAFVGSYLAEENESLEEFLEAYQSKEKNLLEKYKFLSGYQHEAVATAYLLRFEQISTPKDNTEREHFLSIAVNDYLKLSAFVGTDNIPEELLQQSLTKLHFDQAVWTENKDFIKDIYKRFKPTSIFKRNAENKTLTTHRIVQEIMLFQINHEEDILLKTLAEVLADNFEIFDFTNKEKVERYLLHVGVFLEYLENNKSQAKENLKLETESSTLLCNSYARYFEQYGQYKKAEKYYILFKNICKKIKDDNPNLLATSYNNLALLYRKQGRYEESEPLLKKVIEILKKIFGENHPHLAVSYSNLALLYSAQGKYDEAETLLKKTLHIREETLGENHPDAAQSYNNLAGFYFMRGNLNLAEEYQHKSLKIQLTIFGENHPYIATNYLRLGTFCEKEGKYQEALDYFYKAREIYLKFLPKEHPDVQRLQEYIDACEHIVKNK